MGANSKVRLSVLLRVQGLLLFIEGLFMLTVLPVTYFHHGINVFSMPFSALITVLTGFILTFSTRRYKGQPINHREGVITICLSWLMLSVFGGLPFLLSKSVPNFTDAFFEALSGFTTTGSTILTNIETVPKDILLWRSLTQWMGGLAIIVFAVVLIPYLSVGGMQLFMTEMNGINYDKLHPRTMHTAKRLWALYVFFTLLEAVLLHLGDMDWFDAVCHSLTTISSGGFSTRASSIAGYSDYSQIIVMIFMTLSGCNFTLLLITLVRNPKALFNNEEFQHFVLLILGVSAAITLVLVFMVNMSVGSALRSSFFSVISCLHGGRHQDHPASHFHQERLPRAAEGASSQRHHPGEDQQESPFSECRFQDDDLRVCVFHHSDYRDGRSADLGCRLRHFDRRHPCNLKQLWSGYRLCRAFRHLCFLASSSQMGVGDTHVAGSRGAFHINIHLLKKLLEITTL